MFSRLFPTFLFLSLQFFRVKSDTVFNPLTDFSQFETLIRILQQLPRTECVDHFLLLGNSLSAGDEWALKMIDATAKPQAGILSGNVMQVGNYDECLEVDKKINRNQIRGKYCSAAMQPHPKYGQTLSQLLQGLMGVLNRNVENKNFAETTRLSYGFCVPKICTAAELQNVTDFIENNLESPLHFIFDDQYCDGGDGKAFSKWDIFAIVVFAIFALLLVCGTLFDIFCKSLSDGEKQRNIIMAFSVLTNGKKLLSTKTADGSLNCLNGLRVISMMWIVLAHGFKNEFFVPHINSQKILEWRNQTENAIITASSMAVDTFFIISGLLVVYLMMKSQSKGIKFSLSMFYLHRILRLTPALAMTVLWTATLFVHMGSGPFWPAVEELCQKPCERYWWSTLIYLQIYINPNDQCAGQSWYLAVDTQMYFLSPIIFFLLVKWPKKTITAIVVYIILSCSYVFEITWKKHLGTTFLNQDAFQFEYVYVPTYVRGNVYLIGMICGYFIYQTKTNKPLKLTKLKIISLWIFSLSVLTAIVFGHSAMNADAEYNVLESSFFNALTRVGWAIALSIIIVLCVNDCGGLINDFLSSGIFNVLIRVNYSIYLVHLNVLMLMASQGRTPTYFWTSIGFHSFWGDYMFSLGTAVIWTLAFESPVIIIEKIIFQRGNSIDMNKNDRQIKQSEAA